MSLNSLTLSLEGLDDTDSLGVYLAGQLPARATIALTGTLGAGKTRLAQAIATACGVPADLVTSPTFVLCQVYHAERTLYHLDTYRLTDSDEFLELGVDEMFASDALVLVEWADRVADCLPSSRLEIHLEILTDTTRRVTLSGNEDYTVFLENLEIHWKSRPHS